MNQEGFDGMFCEKCGAQTDQKFCPKCGYPVSADPGAQKVQASLNQNQQPYPQQPYPPQAYPQQPYYQQPYSYPPQAYATQPTVIVQNVVHMGRQKNKWTAFFLCLLLGVIGVHKFYEGKVGMGILYIFTMGLFGIGWLVDLIVLLTKPNPYYV